MKTFTIGTNDANQRFDKYLKKLLPNASVSFLYKMLRKKNITLDGKKATGKETLQKGAQVAVFFSDETLHKFMQDTKKLQEEFHMLQRLLMKMRIFSSRISHTICFPRKQKNRICLPMNICSAI